MRRSAVIALPLVACSSTETTTGFCNRFLDLVDDLERGQVPSEMEFENRLAADVLGRPERGGRIAGLWDDFEAAMAEGDEALAFELTYEIADSCASLISAQ